MTRNMLYIMSVAILVSLMNLNVSIDAINGLLTGIPMGFLLACLQLRAFRE